MIGRALQLLIGLALVVLLLHAKAPMARADCHPIPVTAYSPTGVAGCTIYGEGIASWYAGPGVARNDCTWPWTSCQAITITALATGRSVNVTPVMFCDCYTGTADQRIVDLDPATLQLLGLNPARGLYRVLVAPVVTLPDTAMRVNRSRQHRTGATCALCGLTAGNSLGIHVYRYPLRRTVYPAEWHVGDPQPARTIASIALCDECITRYGQPVRYYRRQVSGPLLRRPERVTDDSGL